MVFETWLKTDLKKPVVVQKLSGNLFSADNEGNLIGVEVFDNGEAATLSGNVNGYVIRPDGETVLVDGTLSGNKASILLPSSAYAVVGQESIIIKVGSVTVGACVAYVYKSTTDVIVDPSHVVPSLAELLAKIADCEAATEDANEAASLANEKATLADQKATLADQKATAANTAAGSATSAATAANAAATKIDGMTASANGLNPGSSPTAVVSEVSGHKHITFGIPKGDPGKDFHIAKTFSSIAQMMAYTGTDIEAYDFAMIDTGSVQDPDTGKLYCYEPETQDRWQYIGDLSGAQGIKGETGTGIDHITLNADYTLTIYLDDQTSYTTASIRGATGETPDITIGTVTTLNYDQQAYVTLDSSSTPEDPVFNFGIPKGEPGSAENVYGTTVPMSTTDSTKVATAIGNKLDANQGSTNAGKFMRVSSTGAVAYDSPTERYSSLSDFPATGDEGKLYIAEDTGMMYVWDSEYVPVGGTSSDECEVSGDIVSFETFESKVKKLEVTIEPVQDLHGYDNPWPAGGGKNIIGGKIDSANIETSGVISTGQSFDVYYAKVEANKTYTASGNTDLPDGVVIAFYTSVPESLSTSYNGSRTVLSNTKTFTSPIDGYVALRANQSDTIVQIELGSTATAYAPYENICPISGRTSVDVTRTGKNLLNHSTSVEGYSINASGVITALEGFAYSQLIPVKKGETYTFSFVHTATPSTNYRIHGYDANGNWIEQIGSYATVSQSTGKMSFSVTVPNTITFIRISYAPSRANSFMLEEGSSASAYEAFGEEIYTTKNAEDGKYINADGTIGTNADFLYTDLLPVDSGIKIYATMTNPGSTARYTRVHGYNESGTWVQQIDATQIQANSSAGYLITIPTGVKYIRISIAKSLTNVSFGIEKIHTYPFPQEAGTVYGGTDTIYQDGTRTLVVSKDESDLGSLTWTKYDGTGYADLYYTDDLTTQIGATSGDVPHGICSEFAVVDNATHSGVDGGSTAQPYNTIRFRSMDGRVYLKVAGYSTAAEMTQAVSGVQLVYELAESQVYEMTNQQVLSLLQGQNVLWADCGAIDLTYYRTETAYQVSLNTADIAKLQQDTNGKADKDTEAVEGNFAEFDDSGNPVDSGHKHSDYLTGKRLTAQTLSAGSTTLTFTDSAITTNSTIVPYASVWGISPTAVTVTTGQVVLTFDAMQDAISAYIEVWG